MDPEEFDMGINVLHDIQINVDQQTKAAHDLHLNQLKSASDDTTNPNSPNINPNVLSLDTIQPSRPQHFKSMSTMVNDCLLSADWDDNGTIDYEEFLRSLHPEFTEPAVTPHADHDHEKFFEHTTQHIDDNADYHKKRIQDHSVMMSTGNMLTSSDLNSADFRDEDDDDDDAQSRNNSLQVLDATKDSYHATAKTGPVPEYTANTSHGLISDENDGVISQGPQPVLSNTQSVS
jgi:hypothetical protein